jgi:ankyrin repeat protein
VVFSKSLLMIVSALLITGCGISNNDSQENKSGWDPLPLRALEGDVASLREYATQLDLSAQTYDGGSNLLHHSGSPEVVEFLIGQGVDPNRMDENGWTPFITVAQRGKEELVEAFIAAGVPVDQRSGRHGPSMAFLERRHAGKLNDTPGELLFGCSAGGCTALHGAAATGALEVIETLIRLGLDADVAGAYDLRPLHVAARMGQLEAATLLIELGANTSVRTESGLLPSDMIATEADLINEERRELLHALLTADPAEDR